MMDCLVKTLIGYEVRSAGDLVGHAVEIWFCPSAWRLRYLEVAMRHDGTRRCLLPISAAAAPNEALRRIPIVLTAGEIEDCPWVDPDRTLTRAKEFVIHEHYYWAPYWSETEAGREPRLTRVGRITDLVVEAAGSPEGRVTDLVADADSWKIRALIVRPFDLPAVRIATEAVAGVDLDRMRIRLRRDAARALSDRGPDDAAATLPPTRSAGGGRQ